MEDEAAEHDHLIPQDRIVAVVPVALSGQRAFPAEAPGLGVPTGPVPLRPFRMSVQTVYIYPELPRRRDVSLFR